jgi:hypothetical protein
VISVPASSPCSRIFENLAADRMRARLCAAKTFQYCFRRKISAPHHLEHVIFENEEDRGGDCLLPPARAI